LADLPPVSVMMRDAGLSPKKSMGQNFLFDLNLTRKIARAVPDIENTTVLEVGPGPGGLTRALFECGARRVIAIEKDRSTAPILERIAGASGGRLQVIFGDALKLWRTAIGGAGHFAICANLPYNVGTELLIQWLRAPNIESMTLMFQREVAERLVAKAGGGQYGRLSVLTALTARAKILFDVPNTAFVPPPKVRSSVVQIVPHAPPKNLDEIERLTAALFGQRRKMIRAIIPGADWGAFGLSGAERAEQLPPEKFDEIANGGIMPKRG